MTSYQRLTLHERVQIERHLKKGLSKAEIARRLKRNRSTITREINRWGPPRHYNSGLADWYAMEERTKDKAKKFERYVTLRFLVMRLLKKKWSPEQITLWLKVQYPNTYGMNVSHESIYTYIYILPRGALRKELISHLRQSKGKRYQRRVNTKRSRIPDRLCIDLRDPAVEDRSVPGHWESDLIIGPGQKSAIGTIVERTTRFLIIVPLKNRTASEVRKAFARELRKLPQHVRLSMTHDNGLEMAQHKLFTARTNMVVYFAHPYSSWERGTNENTNGLIRDFFPKDTDFNTVSRYKLKKVQDLLNQRPRKVLGAQTPQEAMQKLLTA
jgi:transposase, IS30 family